MDNRKSFSSILIPSATVFISSACIMILELVASRLIARHLGSSLYTWTAVIGIVLAGITIGNYLGGRIADKFKARKALSTIFILSSAACVAVVILNNLVGEWLWLWKLSWPVRIFSHVALVFLAPSLLLGTISPIVAKMALDRGLSTGRTVGDIYAWGAAGSILGTFAAGFYLIPAIGTIAIIWSVGGVLLVMGILYWVRLWPAYLWLIVFLCAFFMGMSPAEPMQKTSSAIGLKEKYDPQLLYHDETAYCYVAVRQISDVPDRREFIQDKLRHSDIIMGDINNLQYSYEQIHAAITHRLSKDKDKLSVLVIGGGGYVFPRYIENVWPGSHVDVAEIDTGVTKAAMEAFGLPKNTSINTYSMDARNFVDELLRKKTVGEKIPQYDFIYEDALNGYSIPFQLTTKEFNDKLAELLGDKGVYMVELIDIFKTGLFLGAFVDTVQKTFPYVYVMTEAEVPKDVRNTFVVVAAKRQLNLENLETEYKKKNMNLWLLTDSDIKQLKQRAGVITLTDNSKTCSLPYLIPTQKTGR
jgi:spermidine synthase